MEHVLSAVTPRAKRSRYCKATADSGVVLIVENEALIRLNAVQMIEDAGYVALEAASADGAIAILKGRRDIGAVFTDIHMAGSRSGLQLAHAIRRRWPPIHLIVTSGISPEDHLPSSACFIRKPYENAHVIAVLHELFDGT